MNTAGKATPISVPITVRRGGDDVAVMVAEGSILLRALREAGIPIASVCGGVMSCASCHVHITPGGYGVHRPPGPIEAELLAEIDQFIAGSSRLSCQVRVDSILADHVIELVE